MTFSARKITARLVDRKIVFRTGKVYGGNQSEGAVVCLFQSGFAGRYLSSLNLDQTAPLSVSLFYQIAFHSVLNFITCNLSLAREDKAMV
jgi:hypothetical protein